MMFIYDIYLFICLFIYLLESYSIKLKRSIINVLLQIVYFQKVLNVSDMEYLSILPCSVNLMFTALLKNHVECIFLALLTGRHL